MKFAVFKGDYFEGIASGIYQSKKQLKANIKAVEAPEIRRTAVNFQY